MQAGLGDIMYGILCSRPNLVYTVNIVSWFNTNSIIVQWQALKLGFEIFVRVFEGWFEVHESSSR